MKTNMRIVAVAALLVVLAGSGIAGAATMTLSYVTGPTTIYKTADDPNTPEIENRPTKITYSVYGAVTSNSYVVTSAPAMTFYGGVKAFEVNVATTSNLGQVTPTLSSSPANYADALTNFNTTNFLTSPLVPGTVVNSSGVPTEGGVGGIIANGTNAQAIFGTMTSTTSTSAWRATPMTASQLKYWWGNTASSYGDGAGPNIDYNAPVLLFSGELNAVKVGEVTVALSQTTNTRVWGAVLSTGALTLVTPTKVNTSFGLTVGADAPLVTNLAPHDATITSGNVGELDWNTESGGWNDLGHWVDITATAVDDGKPNPPALLTYEWTMTKPSVAPLIIAGKTSALLRLTLDDIDSLGLPAFPGEVWQLKVRASDGALWSAASAPIDVFVPEPATLGLLGFGIVGALLRRRRRA